MQLELYIYNELLSQISRRYPLLAALRALPKTAFLEGGDFRGFNISNMRPWQTLRHPPIGHGVCPYDQWTAPYTFPVKQLRDAAERIAADLATGQPTDQCSCPWDRPSGIVLLIDDRSICNAIDRTCHVNHEWRSVVDTQIYCFGPQELIANAREMKGLNPDVILAGADLFNFWRPVCDGDELHGYALLLRCGDVLIACEEQLPAGYALAIESSTIGIGFVISDRTDGMIKCSVLQTCFAPSRNAAYTQLAAPPIEKKGEADAA